MRQRFLETRSTILALAALLCLVCWPTAHCLGAEAEAGGVSVEVRQLAVMPFLKGGSDVQREKKLERTLDCELLGLCFQEEEVLTGAEETMTRLVQTELRRKLGESVISLAEVMPAYSRIAKEPTDTPRDLAVRLGQSLGADHVLVGLIWRYQERVGSAMAAEEPASVAFSLFLVDVGSQQLVWRDTFDKTQTALSENLFDAPLFFKKGMKWLSAEELASYGVEKILSGLSLRR